MVSSSSSTVKVSMETIYYGKSFTDWKLAAFKYATKHLGMDYDASVRMATDLAWENHTTMATSLTIEKAYLQWMMGTNPFSEHCPRTGLPTKEMKLAKNARNRELALYYFARRLNRSHAESQRFSFDISLMRGLSLPFMNDTYFLELLHDWEAGKTKYSPHRVGLEPENIQNRRERFEEIEKRYPHIAEWERDLLMDDALLGTRIHDYAAVLSDEKNNPKEKS
jgi:hypothetical protein